MYEYNNSTREVLFMYISIYGLSYENVLHTTTDKILCKLNSKMNVMNDSMKRSYKFHKRILKGNHGNNSKDIY